MSDTEAGKPGGATTDLSVTVVICCFSDERYDAVRDAIRSAENLDPPAAEVIVVVDHNPALQDRLERLGLDVRLTSNSEQRGLSGARNSGIAASSGDLVVFLDDDAEADPAMLGHLRSAVAGGALGSVARIDPAWSGRRPAWFPDEFLWVFGCTYLGLAPGPVRNLIGAAMCVRRSVFERVGGFHDGLGRTHASLPLGCEETELCIRARRTDPGAVFIYEPAALCRHRISDQRATWRYFVRRCYAEGLSKAQLAAMSPSSDSPSSDSPSSDSLSSDSLSSERSYVLWTLPKGVLLALGRGLFRLDPAGPAKAAAIVIGLSATVFGFLCGKLRIRHERNAAAPAVTIASAERSP